MDILPDVMGDLVFGRNEFTYQQVLDDFQNTSFIGILTYNISPKEDGILLQALKAACKRDTKAILITNIPKRFPFYHGDAYAQAASKTIKTYLDLLNPQAFGAGMNSYFLFSNHAKIIVTDNIAYWGSSNYSDESKNNFECGTISTDTAVIHCLKEKLFPQLTDDAIPYYKHNFAQAIYQLHAASLLCKDMHDTIFETTFFPRSDYETNFETQWIYDYQTSGITKKLLEQFLYSFEQYDDALGIVNDIVNEHEGENELPEDVAKLAEITQIYSSTFQVTQDQIKTLFEHLEELARYDIDSEANDIISDKYAMVAYDDALDHYVQRAVEEATERYEALIEDAEPIIRDILNQLQQISKFLNELETTLQSLLRVNHGIDNTCIS